MEGRESLSTEFVRGDNQVKPSLPDDLSNLILFPIPDKIR